MPRFSSLALTIAGSDVVAVCRPALCIACGRRVLLKGAAPAPTLRVHGFRGRRPGSCGLVEHRRRRAAVARHRRRGREGSRSTWGTNFCGSGHPSRVARRRRGQRRRLGRHGRCLRVLFSNLDESALDPALRLRRPARARVHGLRPVEGAGPGSRTCRRRSSSRGAPSSPCTAYATPPGDHRRRRRCSRRLSIRSRAFHPLGLRRRADRREPGGRARRSGIAVPAMIVAARITGGALAGLGGMVEVDGVEGRLGPGSEPASGTSASSPAGSSATTRWASSARALFGAISVGGNGLQIDSDLPVGDPSVNILMALVLVRRARRPAAHGEGLEPWCCSKRPHGRNDPLPGPRCCSQALGEVRSERPGSSTSARRARCCAAPSAPTPRRPAPATRGSGSSRGPGPARSSASCTASWSSRASQPARHRARVTFLALGITAMFGTSHYVVSWIELARRLAVPVLSDIAVHRADPVRARSA